MTARVFSQELFEELLEQVVRPGQYLGNEWSARRKDFDSARVRLLLSFPDVYELGMSNFGLKILYQIVNEIDGYMVDRTYAPASDMEALMRERSIALWSWESRVRADAFELVGFSLQYELTYTNVLNMLDLAGIEILSANRKNVFPLTFGGGPSTVNPEPMAAFMDFFIVGDGEQTLPEVMRVIDKFKRENHQGDCEKLRLRLLLELASRVPGVYVPAFYDLKENDQKATPVSRERLTELLGEEPEAGIEAKIPERVHRQVAPLNAANQPTNSMVSYLSLVHDREVLEVRRGCDRGCRFCQPGYTFLPVRERSALEILDLSKKALETSGHQEYSMLSLCVSDYTSLHDTVRALNREHSAKRSSLSFPSQRADRMNLDLAEELKAVRKSGMTLAPEAGTERMRAVINKGLNQKQIITAIESAYASGWNSVKLYFMCCLPTERDEDLEGIIDLLKEATLKCREIRKASPDEHNRAIEFTCTISNFIAKPFTPFQWFGQVTRRETRRKHQVLRDALRAANLKNVTLNVTDPEISLLEVVISRGGRELSDLIQRAWIKGAIFDAWDDRFRCEIWHQAAEELGMSLEQIGSCDRVVGSTQPWEVVHIGLNNWWLVKEWEKALAVEETANCTDNVCH
ncbi:MAG: TIGR03960 family B12-binding radical SAM protein, partial [Candidatus Obscuribacterales bacterium]|nr:TIGR03960 family B12-binding radical SAM protein [Candidatus Obscuribacterales bacterium]